MAKPAGLRPAGLEDAASEHALPKKRCLLFHPRIAVAAVAPVQRVVLPWRGMPAR
jgi:hypothetical protein